MAVSQPPIIYVGTKGFNRSPGSRPPLAVVEHIMEGTLASCDAWFSNPAAQASANYGIGANGEIHCYVEPTSGYWPWANGAVNQPDAYGSALIAHGTQLYGHVSPNVYCVGPGTAILQPDLTWVAAGDLRTGDEVMGFDESQTEDYRRLHRAHVIHTGRARAPIIEFLMADGTTLTSTFNHRWVVRGTRRSSTGLTWMRSDEIVESIRPGNWKRTKPLTLARFFDRVEPVRTYEAGYVAAAFDGEGSLVRNEGHGVLHLSFVQRDNAMLAQLLQMLENLGYRFNRFERLKGRNHGINEVAVRGGRREIARFLSELRPPRLLDRWGQFIDQASLVLYRTNAVPIEAARVLGEREIVTLGTDTKTFIAEGFGAHNTLSIEHEGYTGNPIPDAEWQASIQLTAWLCETYGIGPSADGIMGHCSIDSVNRARCPGFTDQMWADYRTAVEALLAGPEAEIQKYIADAQDALDRAQGDISKALESLQMPPETTIDEARIYAGDAKRRIALAQDNLTAADQSLNF